MWKGGTALAAAAALAAAGATPATGATGAWDGANPFACTLQNAGFGTTVPDPEADPYCVEFDKRRQNVTQLGIVDFLSREPARVAAAGPKCFYFQSDHWRASVVQGVGTALYEWDGHYFFDKARGDGGVWVTNFRVNGQTSDPSTLPFMPPQYGRYFGPGTGGFRTDNGFKADPACVARAARGGVYTSSAPGGTPARPRCVPARGGMRRTRIGPVALGAREGAVRKRLGPPARVHRGWLRWCGPRGSRFLVAVPGDRSGEDGAGNDRILGVYATSGAYRFGSVRPGGRWRGRSKPVARAAGIRFHRLKPGVFAGVRRTRVVFVAVLDRRRVTRAATLLARALK